MKERSGQTGEGHKENHENNQRDGQWGQWRKTGNFSLEKRSLRGNLTKKSGQKEDEGSRCHKEPHGEYKGDKLHQEKDIRNKFF